LELFCGVLLGRAFGNSVTCLHIPACAVALGPGAGEARSGIVYELCILLVLFQFSTLFMTSSSFSLEVPVHNTAKGFMLCIPALIDK